MNKEQRAPYLALQAVMPGLILCSFCQFARSCGSSCGEGAEIECHHPLALRWHDGFARAEESAMEMGDCWGFRSKHDFETAHGMATNWANGKNVVFYTTGVTDAT